MTLAELLDRCAAFAPEFDGGLSNHLPMALVALHRLGADETRLTQFAERYRTRLEPAPPRAEWSAGDPWRDRLGDLAAWPAYRELFAQWLAHEGEGRVLDQALPALLQGVGAAAFHGPIRVAYALEQGPAQELADALAYWACRWLPLGVAAGGDETDIGKLLARLPATAGAESLIFRRMAKAAATPGFSAAVAPLRLDGETLPALARFAAGVYAASGNFTALHLVTGTQALRMLLRWLDEAEHPAALGAFWCAYAAGWVASGARLAAPPDPLPWDVLVARAIASDDEHVIKLVDASREETALYGGDDWQRAATRAVTPSAG